MFNFKERRIRLQKYMAENGYSLSVITDESYIRYLTGYHGSLGIEWGRPHLLLIPVDKEAIIITPGMEDEMVRRQTGLSDIILWDDGLDDEWRKSLGQIVREYKSKGRICIDHYLAPRVVWDFVAHHAETDILVDIAPFMYKMRMIKDANELQLARHAGMVAVAMMKAGHETARVGVREYEISLASKTAGAHKAAELMEKYYQEYEPFNYPCLSFQQIMASGPLTRMCHHKTSLRKLEHGDPLFTCLCGTTNFNGFKLGFDRTFFVGEINPEVIAENAQNAAFAQVKPGNLAENVFKAYAEVIVEAGLPIPFRAGRGLGYAVNEDPQLAEGDKSVLQPGMVFAVDGGALGKNFRCQVGDSVIITDTGYEIITPYTSDHNELICK